MCYSDLMSPDVDGLDNFDLSTYSGACYHRLSLWCNSSNYYRFVCVLCFFDLHIYIQVIQCSQLCFVQGNRRAADMAAI